MPKAATAILPKTTSMTSRSASNDRLADYIARCGIDILVDLNGYSHPSRLDLFMRRPAPVIVGWFNMFATTGIDDFDYIVGDDAVIPPDEERFYSERVLRVPGSYLAFNVLYPVPEVTPPPVLATGSLTFGCFCSQYKITDETIAAFAAILRDAPQARLLLKSRPLADESNRAAVQARFARHGIAAERVLMDGPAEHFAFLAAYERVDIALDAFPYSGGTTTMEALWQGVPVLTFNGDRWAARTSRSLLLAAGLDAWCLADRDAFVAQAIALARSPTTPAELTTLRATLRDRLARPPACDGAALCRGLESLRGDRDPPAPVILRGWFVRIESCRSCFIRCDCFFLLMGVSGVFQCIICVCRFTGKFLLFRYAKSREVRLSYRHECHISKSPSYFFPFLFGLPNGGKHTPIKQRLAMLLLAYRFGLRKWFSSMPG